MVEYFRIKTKEGIYFEINKKMWNFNRIDYWLRSISHWASKG
ncbi:MAG: Hypothetical protein LKU_01460 [Lactobacillus kefiranofaciens]